MTRRAQDEIDALHRRVMALAMDVRRLVDRAVDALALPSVGDADAAAAADTAIDAEEVRVEQQAHNILALYSPAAVDLRHVTSLIKVNAELERVADCAAGVAERLAGLLRAKPYRAPEDLMVLARGASAAVRHASIAFDKGDVAMAQRVIREDDALDALHVQIAQDMTAAIQRGEDPATCLATLMMAKDLERVGDHAQHVAEETLYFRGGDVHRHQDHD